jgi:beta-mannosidase
MWPALSWAVLDSSGSRKLSWYAMREAYRPRVLHFSGTNRDVVVINDSGDIWRDQLTISIFDNAGLLHDTLKYALTIDKESHQRIKLSDKLPTQGFVIAQIGDIRSARTISDTPIGSMNQHEIEISSQIEGNKVVLNIYAKSFTHELCLLPELVAQEVVEVSVQRQTLLPGENISVEITASNSQDAQLIFDSIEDITWSLNKLVSSPSH